MAEKKAKKLLFTRQEMFELNKKVLLKRGVSIEAIAEISFNSNQNTPIISQENYVKNQ
jgi:hypothetical protein